MRMDILTLTTDFGYSGEAVGVMKGVIYKINPNVKILDMFISLPYMPKAVHVGVVDPTVGSEREAIIIETKRGDLLVGPNNGLLVPAADKLGGISRVIEIKNEKYMVKPVSHCFHGRDIFAPTGAWLTRGVDPSEFGTKLDLSRLVHLDFKVKKERNYIEGKVVRIDKYGNVYTNIPTADLTESGFTVGSTLNIMFDENTVSLPLGRTFSDVSIGHMLALDDSFGYLSISVNRGSAAERLKIGRGTKVRVKI